MSTITREQQKQILIDTANHVISRDNASLYSENLRELARIAQASLTAEPDYIRYDCGCCGWVTIDDWRENDVCPKCNHKPMGKTELYTTSPAQDNKREDELTMWVKRLAHSLRKAYPDSKLQMDAMEYLRRKGLISMEDVLR